MADTCEHLGQVRPTVTPSGNGCVECLAAGTRWVSLRMCLDCGHVGCCDSSPGKHASAHFRQTQHPVMQAYGEDNAWKWCFVDEVMVAGDE